MTLGASAGAASDVARQVVWCFVVCFARLYVVPNCFAVARWLITVAYWIRSQCFWFDVCVGSKLSSTAPMAEPTAQQPNTQQATSNSRDQSQDSSKPPAGSKPAKVHPCCFAVGTRESRNGRTHRFMYLKFNHPHPTPLQNCI